MTAKKKSDGAIILGMHRSGTSALTRVVNLLGYDLGTDLIDAAADNPKGYWEDRNVVFINDLILQKLNIQWWDYRPNRSIGWENSGEFRCEREFISTLIQRKIEKKIPFIIKDPRICRTLPIWMKIFKELSLNIQYIEVIRNPFSVAKSLAKRGIVEETCHQLEIDEGMRLWLRYLYESRAYTKGMNVLRLLFPDMLFDRNALVDKLHKFLLNSAMSSAIAQEIEQFLDINSVHQTDADYPGKDELGLRIWDIWGSIREEVLSGTEGDFEHQASEIISIADSFYSDYFSRLNTTWDSRKTELIISNLIAQNQHSSEQTKNYYDQVENYKNQVNDLQNTIAALRGSISWQVTYPFRKLLSFPSEIADRIDHTKPKGNPDKKRSQGFFLSDYPKYTIENDTKYSSRIAYVSGAEKNFHYRCEFQADMLRHLGFDVRIFSPQSINYSNLIDHYTHVVFQWMEYDSDIATFCQNAVKNGLKLYYDCEDVNIRSSRSDAILSHNVSTEGIDFDLKNKLRLMELCDCLIVFDENMGAYWKDVFPDKRSIVSGNLIGLQLRDLCRMLGQINQEPRESITLGYFCRQDEFSSDSGCWAEAILSLLKKYSCLNLIVVGNVDFDSEWECVIDQVKHIRHIDFYAIPDVYRSLDINLEPIENQEYSSKSRGVIGYIESGIMGIPTVASTELSSIIRDRSNGFLCQTKEDWFNAIDELISNRDLRQRVGENAKFDIISNHSFDSPVFVNAPLIKEFSGD